MRAEQRGDYDRGRLHDSLIVLDGDKRTALFLNESKDGIGVSMPSDSRGSLCFGLSMDELHAALMWALEQRRNHP